MYTESINIGQLSDKAESRRRMLERDMTPEQLYSVIAEEIDEIYANA